MADEAKKVARILPKTRQQLVARRHLKKQPSIHDLVEPIFEVLWDDENFAKYFQASVNSEAVEGSLRSDDQEAARMIRDYAVANNPGSPVAHKNLHTLAFSVRIVANRFQVGRDATLNGNGNDDGE